MRIQEYVILLAALAMPSAVLAADSSKPSPDKPQSQVGAPRSPWSAFIVGGGMMMPDFPGSKDYKYMPFVMARLAYSGYYIEVMGPRAKINVIPSGMFEAGPMVSYDGGRDDGVENGRVKLLPKVKSTIEAGGFGKVNFKNLALEGDSLSFGIEFAKAFAGHKGYPRHVVDEIFAQSDVRFAGVFADRGCQARRVEGGIHVDKGIWFFNSGVYQADWNMLGVPMFDKNGQPIGPGVALVPMDQVKVLNDWDPSGLRGSGSTNVTMENVFIPDERIVSLIACANGTQPLTFPDDPLYKLAFGPVMILILAFPVLGIGMHMLESLIELVAKRDIKLTIYTKQHEAAVTHLQIGEASAKIEAAKAILESACRKLDDYAERGELMPKLERASIGRDTAHSNKLVWEAVDLLSSAAGGSWAWKSSELNKVWQDAKVGIIHPFVNRASNYELYGRMAAGVEPDLMPFI